MADKYVCNITKKYVCSELGCEPSEILGDDFRIINETLETYEIGSDEFPLKGSENSGVFKIFKFGSSGFIKIVTMDVDLSGLKRGQFMEVRDIWLAAITSWGNCLF